MSENSRRAWSEVVVGEEYDGHMAAVGQAAANAELLAEFFSEVEPSDGDRVLFIGGGTGQFLDYGDGHFLKDWEVVFTDISPTFLELLNARAAQADLPRYQAMLDDIEATRLKGPFWLAVLVLVLEHVDWKLALANLVKLGCRSALVIIQENPANLAENLSPNRKIPPSLERASKLWSGHLVPWLELVDRFSALGYTLKSERSREVLDEKRMRGALFVSKISGAD